jgi:hypothetical protein
MRKQRNPSINAQILRSAFILFTLVAMCAIPFALAQRNAAKHSQTASRLAGSQLAQASAPVAANGITTPPAAKSPDSVLYDQLNNRGSNGTLSQDGPDAPG